MDRLERAANFAIGLAMIACGILLLLEPKYGLIIVAFILGFALLLYGMRTLIYYVTMARHMAGGLSILLIAIIAIDVGAFALTLAGKPRISIVLYLVGYNVLVGIVTIARGIEAKKLESRWKGSVIHGLVSIALAMLCLVFIGSDRVVMAIYCFGLFYRASVRIASVFRPTEIIYIQ